MAFDPKKWTTKTSEAIAAAMQSATSNNNPELFRVQEGSDENGRQIEKAGCRI